MLNRSNFLDDLFSFGVRKIVTLASADIKREGQIPFNRVQNIPLVGHTFLQLRDGECGLTLVSLQLQSQRGNLLFEYCKVGLIPAELGVQLFGELLSISVGAGSRDEGDEEQEDVHEWYHGNK